MRKGDTILFEAPPSAVAYAAVGGKKEAEGPLADAFDMLIADTQCGEKTWEKAESDFARYCLETALKKGRLQAGALDAVFAGDLQCQCTASAYTMRGFDTPYLGLYGARCAGSTPRTWACTARAAPWPKALAWPRAWWQAATCSMPLP